MSTLSEREAALRRALQNAAASIDPAPDGLQRIQARLRRPRPTAIAWLEAACTDFYLRARAGLQTAGPVVADDMRHIWERFGPSSGSARGRGRLLRWLRPLAALSLAAFVFGAGTYVGLNSSALFPSAPSLNSGTVGPGGSNSGGHGSQGPDGSGSPVGSPGASGSSTSPSGCKKHHKPASYTPPSSSPSDSTSPASPGSPSPSITAPTPTPTPTPSSSSSTTPDPAETASTTGGSTDGTAGTADTGQAGTTLGSRAADTDTSHTRTTTKDSSGHQSKASSQVSPSTTPSANPCATKTIAAIRPPEVVPPGAVGSTTGASAQLMAAKLGATGAALV